MFSLNLANSMTTRMHSSRMHTGRALTVLGGGCVCVSQQDFGGGKEIGKKKEKKISDPPEISDQTHTHTHPPKKISDQIPPQKFQTRPPPPKNFRPDTPTPPGADPPC